MRAKSTSRPDVSASLSRRRAGRRRSRPPPAASPRRDWRRKVGEPQVRAGEIGAGKIRAAEIRGFEGRAHEAHRLVLLVGAAICVFEPSADQTRAGQVGGHTRARQVGAVETRARHLRRKQARLDEAGPGEIGAERPGLVQRRPVELGVRKVRVVEPRRAQVRAGQVEAGKIEPGKALAGEIGPRPPGAALSAASTSARVIRPSSCPARSGRGRA